MLHIKQMLYERVRVFLLCCKKPNNTMKKFDAPYLKHKQQKTPEVQVYSTRPMREKREVKFGWRSMSGKWHIDFEVL
jgi:hypothetical protein